MTVIASTRGYGTFRAGDRRERYQGPADVAAKVDGEDERVTLDAARVAVALGIDVNATNKDGDTALHLAAGLSLDTVIPLLVEQGARLDGRNKRDRRLWRSRPLRRCAASTRWIRRNGRRPRNCCRSSAPRNNSLLGRKRYGEAIRVSAHRWRLRHCSRGCLEPACRRRQCRSAGEPVAVNRDDVRE